MHGVWGKLPNGNSLSQFLNKAEKSQENCDTAEHINKSTKNGGRVIWKTVVNNGDHNEPVPIRTTMHPGTGGCWRRRMRR